MKKLLVPLVLSLILIMPVAFAEELAFTPEERDSYLTPLSKIKMWFNKLLPFTIAGQERQCSVYPDEAGYINSLPYYVSCSNKEGLINFYAIQKDNTWKYMTEVECPANFNPGIYTSPIGKWAYEVYYCPDLAPTCNDGEKRCVSEKETQVCSNGEWISNNCGIGDVCSGGVCIDQAECSVYDKKFGVGGDETKYKMCVNGRYVNYDCPSEYVFDITAEDCVPPTVIQPTVPPSAELEPTSASEETFKLPTIPWWVYAIIVVLLLFAFSPMFRVLFKKFLRGGR